MAMEFSDDFNRADGALGTDWNIGSTQGSHVISSNKAVRGATDGTYGWSSSIVATALSSIDQYAQVKWHSDSYMSGGIVLRANSTKTYFYAMQWRNAGGSQRRLYLKKNGTDLGGQITTPVGGNGLSMSASIVVYLAVNDYMDTSLYQDSGGALDCTARFSCSRLSP